MRGILRRLAGVALVIPALALWAAYTVILHACAVILWLVRGTAQPWLDGIGRHRQPWPDLFLDWVMVDLLGVDDS